MNEIILIIIIASFLMVMAGTTEYYNDPKKIINLSKKIKPLNQNHYLAGLIWSLLLVLYIFTLLKKANVNINIAYIFSVIYMASFIGFVILYINYNLADFIKNNSKILSIIFGTLALIITIVTNMYVDLSISDLTSVKADNFPSAQRFITFLLAPILWLIVLLLISIFFYFLHSAFLLTFLLRENSYINGVYKSILFIFGIKLDKKRKFNPFLDLAPFIGLMFFIYISPMALSKVINSETFTSKLTDLVVHSSYIMAKDRCKNISEPKTMISFLKNDSISIAKKINSKYVFYVDKCIRE